MLDRSNTGAVWLECELWKLSYCYKQRMKTTLSFNCHSQTRFQVRYAFRARVSTAGDTPSSSEPSDLMSDWCSEGDEFALKEASMNVSPKVGLNLLYVSCDLGCD